MLPHQDAINLKAQLKAIDDLEDTVDEIDWEMDEELEDEDTGLEAAAEMGKKAAPWLLGVAGIGAMYYLLSKLYKKFFGKVEVASEKIKKTFEDLAANKGERSIPQEDFPKVTVKGKLARLVVQKYSLASFDKLLEQTDKVLALAESTSDVFKDTGWATDKTKATALDTKMKKDMVEILGAVKNALDALAMDKAGNLSADTDFAYATNTLRADTEEFHAAMRKGNGLSDRCEAIGKQFELVAKLDNIEGVVPEAKAFLETLKECHVKIKKQMGEVAGVAGQLVILSNYISSQISTWKSKNISMMNGLVKLIGDYDSEVSKTDAPFYKTHGKTLGDIVKSLREKSDDKFITKLQGALKAIRAGELYRQAVFNKVFSKEDQAKVDLVLKGQYPYQFEKGKSSASKNW